MAAQGLHSVQESTALAGTPSDLLSGLLNPTLWQVLPQAFCSVFFLAYSPADLLLCFHKHQILLILSSSRYIDVQFWLKAVEFRNRGLGSINTLEEGAWTMQLEKKK